MKQKISRNPFIKEKTTTPGMITAFSLVCLLHILVLSGCNVSHTDETAPSLPAEYRLDYESTEKNGRLWYAFGGNEYRWKEQVFGRSPNADCDSYFVLLTNREGISFDEASQAFFSSSLSEKKDFVIVEWGTACVDSTEQSGQTYE